MTVYRGLILFAGLQVIVAQDISEIPEDCRRPPPGVEGNPKICCPNPGILSPESFTECGYKAPMRLGNNIGRSGGGGQFDGQSQGGWNRGQGGRHRGDGRGQTGWARGGGRGQMEWNPALAREYEKNVYRPETFGNAPGMRPDNMGMPSPDEVASMLSRPDGNRGMPGNMRDYLPQPNQGPGPGQGPDYGWRRQGQPGPGQGLDYGWRRQGGCTKEHCVLRKHNLLKGDNNINYEAFQNLLITYSDNHPEARNAIDTIHAKCFGRSLQIPPHMCDAGKLLFCMSTTYFLNCPNWNTEDTVCNAVLQHINKCKGYFGQDDAE